MHFIKNRRNSIREFLKIIITTDELGYITINHTTKQQNSQWKFPSYPTPKMAKAVNSTDKQMIFVLFDHEGIVYAHAVEAGRKVNKTYYAEVLQKL